MKRISLVMIVGLFFGASFITCISGDVALDDQLDQQQTRIGVGYDEIYFYLDNDFYRISFTAQEFKPSLPILTRIELPLVVDGEPYDDLIISIRQDIHGEDLTSVQIAKEELPQKPEGNFDWEWFEIDFEDIEVYPNTTYYIVATTNVDDNWDGQEWHRYLWNTFENFDIDPDPYPEGFTWDCTDYDDGYFYWSDNSHQLWKDHSFKTYGYDDYENDAPSIPTIDGFTTGRTNIEQTYQLLSFDPDGDDIYYCVDWGDESGEICLGPSPTGEILNASYTWTSDGNYVIKVKARDINDAESDWATFEVEMPKHKSINTFLQKIIESFPLLGRFLQLFLSQFFYYI